MSGDLRVDRKAPCMTPYQHTAPARSGGTDVAAWALVALIVALVCAAAGWAVASNAVPGTEDVARSSELAALDGLARGEAAGYSQGARLGRRQASMRTRSTILAERRQATREGYDAGYAEGRAKAGDPNAYSVSGPVGGAYPSAGYEDVLATGLFGGDVPGYSDSAYDSLGFGAGSSTPYLGSSSRATSLGDDYAGLGY